MMIIMIIIDRDFERCHWWVIVAILKTHDIGNTMRESSPNQCLIPGRPSDEFCFKGITAALPQSNHGKHGTPKSTVINR